jgi:RNA polymerase sigma-70 factor (TIGR02943 family)
MDKQKTGGSLEVDPNLWLDEHGDYLFRFALSRLRDGDAAEEVVQDTFVSALKNVKQFSGRSSERAWLLGILKNKIVDVYRKRNRDPINVDGDNADISEMLFDQNGSWKKEIRPTLKQSLDSVDREEFWAILKKCLGLLPSRQADAFTLRTMDEQSTENICKQLEITPTNYWVILHRARLQLSGCMKQQWFDGEKS